MSENVSRGSVGVSTGDSEVREEQVARLCEDVRRTLGTREWSKAARYLRRLTDEYGENFYLILRSWPVCLECNGTAEVVDPEHPERRTTCPSAPGACQGTQGGRMSPEQHRAYLAAHLTPRVPTLTESVPRADAEGNVPRLPPDTLAPTPAA